jgi:hypothetical protein
MSYPAQEESSLAINGVLCGERRRPAGDGARATSRYVLYTTAHHVVRFDPESLVPSPPLRSVSPPRAATLQPLRLKAAAAAREAAREAAWEATRTGSPARHADGGTGRRKGSPQQGRARGAGQTLVRTRALRARPLAGRRAAPGCAAESAPPPQPPPLTAHFSALLNSNACTRGQDSYFPPAADARAGSPSRRTVIEGDVLRPSTTLKTSRAAPGALDFLGTAVLPAVREALLRCNEERPEDPLLFLAQMLVDSRGEAAAAHLYRDLSAGGSVN